MTLVTGTITDTSGKPLNGTLTATGLNWTTHGDTTIAPESDPTPLRVRERTLRLARLDLARLEAQQ